ARWVALVAAVALGAVALRFAWAWASQLAEGRAHTEGPGYGVMVLLTPIVLVGVLLFVAPLGLHLVLWRVQRQSASPLSTAGRVGAWTLGLVALSGVALAAAYPVAQAQPPRPLLGVAFTRGGDEVLAWDERALVRGWDSRSGKGVGTWTAGSGGHTTLLAVSPFDRWAVVRHQGKTRLLALADGGGATQVLFEHDGDVWGFLGPGRAAVARGPTVTLLSSSGTAPPPVRWRARVTGLSAGEGGGLVLADEEGAVVWLDPRTGEPQRTVRLDEAVVRLQTFDDGRQAVAVTKSGAAHLLGGQASTALTRRRKEDPLAPFAQRDVLVAYGPEVHRFAAPSLTHRPHFNHGQAPLALAGHPLEPRAAIVLPTALWLVGPGESAGAPLSERLLHEW
ncbi:MAG: hypothetical protein AB1938_28375, partial [Myxococcota bacterium]